MQDRPRRFKGFAVIERRDGSLIWGTFRPSAAEAWAVFEKWNPPIEGEPPRAALVAVEIKIDFKAPADI